MSHPLTVETVILAQPRGFCAGVQRAIDIVELALECYGPPIYVRHEIVHNRHVVTSLEAKGAIFVDELDQVPEGATTIFSAHGVANQVVADAEHRGLSVLDATCPLVTKVHREAQRYEAEGRRIILIGHAGHPEVEGTAGRVSQPVFLVSSVEDVDALDLHSDLPLAYVTQTTLSVDDTVPIIARLHARFPSIVGPDKRDICYATQNRQNAVRLLAKQVDLLLVIGAPNSSNSNRLRDLGEQLGVPSYLIEDASTIDPSWLQGPRKIGITAGASAPETIVQSVIRDLQSRTGCAIEIMDGISENVLFKLPATLEADVTRHRLARGSSQGVVPCVS
jgi:4-hydroxy-3-methylbut-2-enyl diphosphate reductase